MAKQGINPVEQHVEKIVVGIAALLFAFVVYNYVMSTPVTVRVGGTVVSPSELDGKLGEAAQQIADVYKRATFVQPTAGPDSGVGNALVDMDAALKNLDKVPPVMVSPVRWWPEVPKSEDIDPGIGKHGLAKIIAPTINAVFSGVTNAGLAVRPVSLSELATAPVTPVAAAGQDTVWTFLRLNFDMQQQYDISRQTNYTREQANLILFLDVQVQRQRVYPDGSTGPWEDVNTYKTVQVSYPQTVAVREDGSLAHADDQAIRPLFAGLVQAQQNILYPLPQILGGDPFPPYYANGNPPTPLAEATPTPGVPPTVRPSVRQPPRAAPVRSARGGGRGEEHSSGGGESDPGRGGGGERAPSRGPTASPGAGSVDKQALQQANAAILEASKAYDEKRYAEALQILGRARNVTALQRKVTDLEAKINAAYTKWQQDEANAAARKADDQARNTEIWVYDMQAPAGKTCRYRARLALFNVFAHPDSDRSDLTNPQDGSKVALLSEEWSVPSDPITVADSRYFFVTAATPEKEQANVDIFRFQQGRWFKDTVRSLGIGDSIGDIKPANTAGGRVDVDYRTGCVVVDVGTDPAATVGSDTKGAKLNVKRLSSPVLVSMDSDGAIEPHWAAVDRINPLSKELDAKVKAAGEPLAPPASGR